MRCVLSRRSLSGEVDRACSRSARRGRSRRGRSRSAHLRDATSSGRIAPLAEIVRKRGGTSIAGLPSRGTTSRDAWRASDRQESVDPVADDPASERLARMRADLVCPAGQRLELDQSGAIANREPAPARCRRKPCGSRPSSTPLRRSSASRAGVDHPGILPISAPTTAI